MSMKKTAVIGNGEKKSDRERKSEIRYRKRRKRMKHLMIVLAAAVFLAGGIFYVYRYGRWIDIWLKQTPDWVEADFLTPNSYSRPCKLLGKVNNIVIHYVGNPGTSAVNNRNYFESLKDSHATKASSHFIVGLEGEVIQCIPLREISYCSNNRNSDTVSVEVCHPDETGKFNDLTYASVVRLTAWLCDHYGLTSSDVIRHYDVTGKLCPLYYVEHEDAWEQFLADVEAALTAGNF